MLMVLSEMPLMLLHIVAVKTLLVMVESEARMLQATKGPISIGLKTD